MSLEVWMFTEKQPKLRATYLKDLLKGSKVDFPVKGDFAEGSMGLALG